MLIQHFFFHDLRQISLDVVLCQYTQNIITLMAKLETTSKLFPTSPLGFAITKTSDVYVCMYV